MASHSELDGEGGEGVDNDGLMELTLKWLLPLLRVIQIDHSFGYGYPPEKDAFAWSFGQSIAV